MVRLRHVLHCTDDEDQLGDTNTGVVIKLAHVAEFQVQKDLQVNSAAIAAFIDTNAYFVIYPYVRQIVTSVTAELGLIPVVLDYMQRENWPYSSDE